MRALLPTGECVCSYDPMSKHNTFRLFTVALGSKGMPICSSCQKWTLLAGSCSVCVSAGRLVAAATGPRLPPTQEAQYKVTKILDGAFYSIPSGAYFLKRTAPRGESLLPVKGLQQTRRRERVLPSHRLTPRRKSQRAVRETRGRVADVQVRRPVLRPTCSPRRSRRRVQRELRNLPKPQKNESHCQGEGKKRRKLQRDQDPPNADRRKTKGDAGEEIQDQLR